MISKRNIKCNVLFNLREAWKKCDNLTKQEAKKNYINLFKEIVTRNLPGTQVKDDDSIKISDFTNSAVYSSTAQETKRELESHFNNLQDKLIRII